jgi:serine/threonine protein kinase
MMMYGPGDQIGTYRLIGPYPGGGFRAVHVALYDRVHLDVRELCDDWRQRAVQVLRASTLLAALDHPGIARIVGRGLLPDRRPWVASELADGVVLSELLARRVLAVDETVALVRDLAAIAIHVHAKGLVHGAIHPHAIVMRTGDRAFPIQLGAWGELRAAGTDADDAIPLTPYAAPESRFGCAADIYSIGMLAYRGLTGRFPSSPIELVAGVPGAVSALIVSMLACDPAARPDAAKVHATTLQLTGDRLLSGPRFARPRWTPAPEEDSYLAREAAYVLARLRRY